MTPNGTDRILDKIKKLVRLSESSNEHEAALAASKAQELLQEYNLTIDSIRPDVAATTSIVKQSVDPNFNNWGRTYWKIDLADALAINNFCRVTIGRWKLYFIGKPADVEVVIWMFNNLSIRLEVLATAARDQYVADLREQIPGLRVNQLYGSRHPRTFKNSWLYGAVNGISTQLRERKRQFRGLSEQTRALITNREVELDAFFKEKYSGIQLIDDSRYMNNSAAVESGFETGRTLDLQGAVSSAKSKHLLR